MANLIGIFGGTFDPIHKGHLDSVKLLCESVPFSQVHWVLSARPPHKGDEISDSQHRYRMLELALAELPNHIADDCEINRPQKSYTFDTVVEFKERYPNQSLVLIIGGDSMQQLSSWHRFDELADSVNWVVLHRPGYEFTPPKQLVGRVVESSFELQQSAGGKFLLFEHSNNNISSTELRAELDSDQRFNSDIVKYNLSSSVISYIREQQLYKIAPMNSEQIKDQVVEALDNVKAQDVKVIDIADISDFADYMVVASGTSDTHVKALAREASNHLRRQDVKPLNEDGADVGEWVLVDFGDVVLHVMRPEVREYYDLEKLWDEDVRNLVKKHREEQTD